MALGYWLLVLVSVVLASDDDSSSSVSFTTFKSFSDESSESLDRDDHATDQNMNEMLETLILDLLVTANGDIDEFALNLFCENFQQNLRDALNNELGIENVFMSSLQSAILETIMMAGNASSPPPPPPPRPPRPPQTPAPPSTSTTPTTITSASDAPTSSPTTTTTSSAPTLATTTSTPSPTSSAPTTSTAVPTTSAPTTPALNIDNTDCSTQRVAVIHGALSNSIRSIDLSSLSLTETVIEQIDGEENTLSMLLSESVIAGTTESAQSEDALILVGPAELPSIVRVKISDLFDESATNNKAEFIGVVVNMAGMDIVDITSDCNQRLIGISSTGELYNLNIDSADNFLLTPTQFSSIPDIITSDNPVIAFNFDFGYLHVVQNEGTFSSLSTYSLSCSEAILIGQSTIEPANDCGDGDISALSYIGDGLFYVACSAGQGVEGNANIALLSTQTRQVFIDSISSSVVSSLLTDVLKVDGLLTLSDDPEIRACRESDNGCIDIEDLECNS